MNKFKNPYFAPESELYIVAIEESILSGNGSSVIFGPGDAPGPDPGDPSDEGEY